MERNKEQNKIQSVQQNNDTKTQVELITEKLEAGMTEIMSDGGKYEDYLRTISKFHRYSLNNTMLIYMQNPEASYVAGFDAWEKKFHRHVKKGAHGLKILAPSPYKMEKDYNIVDPDTNEPIIGKDGLPLTERKTVTIPAYKAVTVFDVSQTYGEPLPEIIRTLDGDNSSYTKLMNAIEVVSPVPIEISEITGRANGYYSQKDKKIVIKDGLSQNQTIKTAIHEIAHALLHDEKSLEHVNWDKNEKEVQAESIAYTVCNHLGLDTSQYSFGYIASWSEGRDLFELKDNMSVIRNTASNIIEGIEKQMYLAEREERIVSLAQDIDSFERTHDPYAYMDKVKNQEEYVKKLQMDIRDGNIDGLSKVFVTLAGESSNKAVKDKADVLIERLEMFRKKEKQLYIAEEQKMTRSHRKRG